ncbi:50S ribosomal protein L19, chloroplastic-like [Impatiens glandulifera]|uniref:50S ribosomal protein L19, chloroplastic-like n=1 Tax=Impatiens glandulifera TaxID=253017 RepID=UPI001FB0E4E3|nr:50S ribosomal protein L19, chloroplastic-like [Impatiens glandulifera]
MASSILAQTMFMFPKSSAQSPVSFNSLAFSSVVSRSSRISLTANMKSSVCSLVAKSERKSFSIRSSSAEADIEVEAVVTEVVSEEKPPRKQRVKLGDIMGILNKKAVEASESARPIPDIRTGDVVEIKLEVPENRRRLSIYKGIVMSRQNAGIHTTIRIRRIIAGIGVEIVFPLYSPNIKEIKVVSHRKVRRARLYYLRDKLPRLSTFK